MEYGRYTFLLNGIKFEMKVVKRFRRIVLGNQSLLLMIWGPFY